MCHVAVVGSRTASLTCLSRDRTPPAPPWVVVCWGRSPSLMRSGVLIPSIMCTDGCACMLMVERTCQLIPWLIAKQSDVTLRFTLDNICFWCQQLTRPPYTGLGRDSSTTRIRSMPAFEAIKATPGGGAFRVRRAVPPRACWHSCRVTR